MEERVEARLLGVREEPGGTFVAELELVYGGRSYRLRVKRLLRRPGRLGVRIREPYVIVELRDERGGPLASCCIHRGHLEKGCMECPSLVTPPREG